MSLWRINFNVDKKILVNYLYLVSKIDYMELWVWSKVKFLI